MLTAAVDAVVSVVDARRLPEDGIRLGLLLDVWVGGVIRRSDKMTIFNLIIFR